MSAPAYRAGGEPVSRQAFYARACDPQRSSVVEACAGAGKTWMLVSRILRALLDGAQPHEILAITFTRKAAGEMRERLAQWLREFASPQCDPQVRLQALIDRGLSAARAAELAPRLEALQAQLLDSGRPVEIRTFHAWFSQLLRASPLELLDGLGVQPDAELIEDIEEHQSAIHRRFHAAVLADAQLLADHAALTATRGRSQLRKWLDTVLQRRVEIELADEAGVLEASVEPAHQRWPDLVPEGHPAQTLLTEPTVGALRELVLLLGRGGVRAQEAAIGLERALACSEPAAAFELACKALLTSTGTPRKQLGGDARLDALQQLMLQIVEQAHQHESCLEHRRMVRLARALLAEFAAYKRERGLADMADLERCALALLRDSALSGWVQERLDARLRHVMIDEFQDTSPLQWHALHAWLSAYAGAGGGASGQRAPSVFIVGDPKQSIYRFRRAEPRVFEAASRFVVDGLDGQRLACDHTRRNAPEVLAAINGVFEAAARAGEFDGFRRHTTEVAATGVEALITLPPVLRPPSAQPGAGALPAAWRDSLTEARHEPETVLREAEASRVAHAVRALVDRDGIGPGEVFVLCRKRESLRLAAQALHALHLPCAAVEDNLLMDAPEARDLVAVLDVLVTPQHRLSLAQALRSPLFGASDDDLIALAQQAGEHPDWWRALFELEPASPALQRARRLLAGWQRAALELPPHDLLDRIVCEGELRERVAATVPPEQRAGALNAIDAVLGQALMLDGARYATPYNFVRALKRRSVHAAAPAVADAVQLLTVHGAKGLEARVVFVMDSDPTPPSAETATLLVDWPVDAERPRRCAFVYNEARCPPSLRALQGEEVTARRREELNGLYVAMTRARERLVFSATEPNRRDPLSVPWWQRIEPCASDASLSRLFAASTTVRSGASTPLRLQVLPTVLSLHDRRVPGAGGARAPTVDTTSLPNAGSVASRLGQALHRTLEWVTDRAETDLAGCAAAAAVEFGSERAEVERLARRILGSPACQRFFMGTRLLWAANEVPVGDGGELLRIDRLVLLEDEGGARSWWVLDYKLEHAPQQQPDLRRQLLRYRGAIAQAQPGASVRCAFVTADGAVVEIESD